LLSPLSKTTVTEEVLERVKELITSGKVKTGEQLPSETQLSAMLETSRNTVREVLITLQAQGYVEIKRGKGVFVVDRSKYYVSMFMNWFKENEPHIQQLLEVREILEPSAAKLAAQRITNEEIQALDLIHQDFVRAVRNGNIEDMALHDQKFHQHIIKASRNEMLDFFYTSMSPSLHGYLKKVFSAPAKPIPAIEVHNKILQALKSNDEEMAYKLMADHIHLSKTDMINLVKKIEKK